MQNKTNWNNYKKDFKILEERIEKFWQCREKFNIVNTSNKKEWMSRSVRCKILFKLQQLNKQKDISDYIENLEEYIEYCINNCNTVDDLWFLIDLTNKNNEKNWSI